MKRIQNAMIVGIMLAIGSVFFLSNCADQSGKEPDSRAAQAESQTGKLPTLIDVGKGTCIPCKKMKPILDELTLEYQGKAIVKVIDLRHEPQEAKKYKIRLIPTQIFYDAEGNEVYRHEGFMDKQSIKSKFAEMGVY
ncbi:MAG: thioredoxin family protein [Candidatus Zixiibacteriota bacterium]